MVWPFNRKQSTPSPEKRSVSIGDPNAALLFGVDGLDVVSESTALSLSGVYRAVSLICGSVATLPLRTIEADDGQRHRVRSIFNDPCKDRYTPFEWKQLVMLNLLLHGNAFLLHVYNRAGALHSLVPVHPSLVTVRWAKTRYGQREFEVNAENTEGLKVSQTFTADDMTMIMGMSLDGLRGVSPLTIARRSLSTSLNADKNANSNFTKGTTISGLVTPTDEMITEDEAQDLQRHLNQSLTGSSNAGKIAVLNANLQFQPWSLSPADAQFLQSRTFQIDEIARWYGIPPHLLGLVEKNSSWGQGVAEQNRGLARYTLQPWTSAIEDRLSRLVSKDRQVEFDYKMFLNPSPEDEIELVLKQVNGGLMTPNEGRAILNLPPAVEPINDLLRLPAGSLPPDMFDGVKDDVVGIPNGGSSDE